MHGKLYDSANRTSQRLLPALVNAPDTRAHTRAGKRIQTPLPQGGQESVRLITVVPHSAAMELRAGLLHAAVSRSGAQEGEPRPSGRGAGGVLYCRPATAMINAAQHALLR